MLDTESSYLQIITILYINSLSFHNLLYHYYLVLCGLGHHRYVDRFQALIRDSSVILQSFSTLLCCTPMRKHCSQEFVNFCCVHDCQGLYLMLHSNGHLCSISLNLRFFRLGIISHCSILKDACPRILQAYQHFLCTEEGVFLVTSMIAHMNGTTMSYWPCFLSFHSCPLSFGGEGFRQHCHDCTTQSCYHLSAPLHKWGRTWLCYSGTSSLPISST